MLTNVSRRCSYCRENGHNIRSCEKRKKDDKNSNTRINDLINEFEQYKLESFRKRQVISTLLISQSQLERKNAILNNVILFYMKDTKPINNDVFAVNSMKELLVKAKECCDICYEEFEYDKIVIKSCWHKCCTTCNSKLDKCHVCRI